MYFKCEPMRATISIKSCEQFRVLRKKGICETCTIWQSLTTEAANLLPEEGIIERAQKESNLPRKHKVSFVYLPERDKPRRAPRYKT